jgi:glycosyltransferase involved in cell wall biosynthesis
VRILVLSHFPPMRGGIAAYAEQGVARLREQGHEVSVASPEPSDAEHVIDLAQPGSGRALACLARQYERLIVEFHPDMLGPPERSLPKRSVSLLRLAAGMRAAPSCELSVHEMNYGLGPTAPLQRLLTRPIWTLADKITVHTERERQDFARGFWIDPKRITVVSQARHMRRRLEESRAGARTALGLPQDKILLLAIGFLQPNKGFDRAIRAFAEVEHENACLYVVGSTWRADDERVAHLEELRRLAAETPHTELREGYLDDDQFDRWILAADALVLPYRYGWSSNVMERGLLYDRPVVMSDTGGMAEQGADRPGVVLVRDDPELVETLRKLVADPVIR